jgi:hypothetical protein
MECQVTRTASRFAEPKVWTPQNGALAVTAALKAIRLSTAHTKSNFQVKRGRHFPKKLLTFHLLSVLRETEPQKSYLSGHRTHVGLEIFKKGPKQSHLVDARPRSKNPPFFQKRCSKFAGRRRWRPIKTIDALFAGTKVFTARGFNVAFKKIARASWIKERERKNDRPTDRQQPAVIKMLCVWLQLTLTGLAVMCFARRKNRYSYLVSLEKLLIRACSATACPPPLEPTAGINPTGRASNKIPNPAPRHGLFRQSDHYCPKLLMAKTT